MVYRYSAGNPLHPEALKEKQRALRDGFSTPLTLRVHRALSWLRRAEAEQEGQDVCFILRWLGFTAAYAGDVEASASSSAPEGERGLFQSFFSTLVKFDGRHRVYDAVWQHQNGVPGYEDWEHKLERGRLAINHALREHDTVRILSILFDRLYVLRNQLVHGGATWNSDVNRDQVRDGASLLGCLLPIFVDLMMDNPSMNGRCRTIRWWTDPTRCNCGRIHSAASRYP
jgi:hypothetical protein